MNMLDVAIVVTYVAVFCAVFLLGITGAVIWLLSLVAGLVGASAFSPPLADVLIERSEGVEPAAGDLIAFVGVLLVVAAAIGYVLTRSYEVARGRYRVPAAPIGGIASLAFLGIMSFVVAAATIVVLVQILDSTAPEFSMRLAQQIEESLLAQQALEFSGLLYRLVDMLTPGPAAEILRPRDG